MNTYTLFWSHGKSEIVTGSDLSIAMTLKGYSAGAVRALDFHAEGDQRDNYEWDKVSYAWKKKSPPEKSSDTINRNNRTDDDSLLNPLHPLGILNPLSPLSPLNPIHTMSANDHISSPDPTPSHSDGGYHGGGGSDSTSYDSGSSSFDSGSSGGGDF